MALQFYGLTEAGMDPPALCRVGPKALSLGGLKWLGPTNSQPPNTSAEQAEAM